MSFSNYALRPYCTSFNSWSEKAQMSLVFSATVNQAEKQTSTYYKNRVHEISDYNNYSRGAGGVWGVAIYQ